MDQRRTDMFELLNDLQSARLNDQRTNMPRNTINPPTNMNSKMSHNYEQVGEF